MPDGNSMNPKSRSSTLLLAFVALTSTFSHAQSPSLGDIVRNADGSVRHMDYYYARSYCNRVDSRLPTIRELAVYSQSLGARGIRETAHPDVAIIHEVVQTEIAQMRGDGYYPVYTVSDRIPRPTVIDFYFNYSGYQPPAGDLGYYWFWSLSPAPEGRGSAYYLRGDQGLVDFTYTNNDSSASAVRCIR